MWLSEKYYVVAMSAIFFILCIIGSDGKPSFSFNLPRLTTLAQNRNEPSIKLKHYTGTRVDRDALRMVYVNDQTVAVVELGENKLLLNCELIEVLNTSQVPDVLVDPKLSTRIMFVSFHEMITLMNQCTELQKRELRKSRTKIRNNTDRQLNKERGIKNPFTILNGIIPGTKWCGTGDIASDYYDLGAEPIVDICCRAHDLCPMKIRAFSQKYNLTNNSLYTKSHCQCDDDFFHCLKTVEGSAAANFMGNIYFNLVQIPCLDDTNDVVKFKKPRSNF